MAGLAIVQASSDAWPEAGAQAERAFNTGWILDQTLTSTGGFTTAAAPSTATAFLSTGDGTTGSGNGYYALGRPIRVVHGGGTAYGVVTAASLAGGQTTVTVGRWTSGGTTSLSTASVASAAVGPIYGGPTGNAPLDCVLLGETVLGAQAATISFTSISTGFRHLKLVVIGAAAGAAAVQVSGTYNADTGANYDSQRHGANSTSVVVDEALAQAAFIAGIFGPSTAASNHIVLDIPGYASTSLPKVGSALASRRDAVGAATIYHIGHAWRSAAGITQISLTCGSTEFRVGTIASLYGLRGSA